MSWSALVVVACAALALGMGAQAASLPIVLGSRSSSVPVVAAHTSHPSSATAVSPFEQAFHDITTRMFPPLLPGLSLPYRTITTTVTTRDGVELYTVVFVPLSLHHNKFDTLMVRTPYGTDGVKSEGEAYVNDGFAVLMQDFRGRYRSKGSFECWFNASTDAADTIAWLVAQPWSSGIVFQQGTSAPGIATYFTEIAAPSPAVVRALYPVVATGELHTTIFQGGAYRYNLIHGWLTAIGEPGFESNFTTHEGMSDYYNNVTMTDKWSRVTAPAVHLTGWYDIFNQQQIDAFQAFQSQSLRNVSNLNFLIIMPTGHCAGGQVPWPNASEGWSFANTLAVTLFKAQGSAGPEQEAATKVLANTSAVYWYVMGPGLPGSTGNFWTSAAYYPPPKVTRLYLVSGNSLNLYPDTQASSQSFVYDPTHPMPTLGGNTLGYSSCGPWDQLALEQRSDVLVFTSNPLTDNFVVMGHMHAQLFVSSNCTDTDFTVKITDVFPNGTSMLVQNGITRMRWRHGPTSTSPDLITPGSVYNITVDMWSTSYVFNKGHSVRFTISSSNFPLFSANPNTGKPLSDTTTPPLVAHNSVYFGGASESFLELPFLLQEEVVPTPLPNLRAGY